MIIVLQSTPPRSHSYNFILSIDSFIQARINMLMRVCVCVCLLCAVLCQLDQQINISKLFLLSSIIFWQQCALVMTLFDKYVCLLLSLFRKTAFWFSNPIELNRQKLYRSFYVEMIEWPFAYLQKKRKIVIQIYWVNVF